MLKVQNRADSSTNLSDCVQWFPFRKSTMSVSLLAHFLDLEINPTIKSENCPISFSSLILASYCTGSPTRSRKDPFWTPKRIHLWNFRQQMSEAAVISPTSVVLNQDSISLNLTTVGIMEEDDGRYKVKIRSGKWQQNLSIIQYISF